VRVVVTPGGSGGATTFDIRPDGTIEQSMHIEGPLDRILDSVLPHEVAHTVLIHHLGFIAPRWADEGVAVLAESEAERHRHDEAVRRLQGEGRTMALRRLFEAKDYPQDAMVMFAQGHSVVKYMTTEMDDHPTFVAFLAEAHRVGWDKALQRYYRCAGVDDLERCWLAWLRETKVPPTMAVKPSAPPLKVEIEGNTCRTSNFVVEAESAEAAERVGRAAEDQRKLLAERWTGRAPPTWAKPCKVRVTLTGDGGASGGRVYMGGLKSVRGFEIPVVTPADLGKLKSSTSVQFESDGAVEANMILEGPLDTILGGLLAREVTHAVIANHLGFAPPRWADEGMAVMAEETEARRHDELWQQVRNQGRVIPLRRLIYVNAYPEDVTVVDAQGYSLVRFLTSISGRPTFVAFLAAARGLSWDSALEKYYGYRNVDQLQNAWQLWLRIKQDQQGAPASVSPTQQPVPATAVPAPAQEPDDVTQARDAYLAAMKRRADEVRKEIAAKQAELRAMERQIELLDPKRSP
jgi:hypothetical protein